MGNEGKERHVRAAGAPGADGKPVEAGTLEWLVRFPLADGTTLVVHVGREGMDDFRAMVLQEELAEALAAAGRMHGPYRKEART